MPPPRYVDIYPRPALADTTANSTILVNSDSSLEHRSECRLPLLTYKYAFANSNNITSLLLLEQHRSAKWLVYFL